MNYSEQIKHSNTDEWYTYKESVSIIVPFLKQNGYSKILCPFDKKESNYVSVLKENGFDVTFTHIETGTDFFGIENLRDYDAVVSNPPFSKRQRILERLYEYDVPFALIMNFNGLFDSKSRWKLFKDNNFELLVPCGRMHFYNKDGEANSPNFQSVYVCNKMLPQQITFIER
jgi:hypothetical protein